MDAVQYCFNSTLDEHQLASGEVKPAHPCGDRVMIECVRLARLPISVILIRMVEVPVGVTRLEDAYHDG